MLRCWCCCCPLVCYTFLWPICSAIPAYPLTDLWNLFILLYQMRYLKNKKSTLLHYCSHCSELLGQKQKREVQCVTPSRTRAIRATGCARWCAHCARIDFLWRPSWQIPSPRVEVPRDPLRKLSRNFKGSRLSAQLLLLRNAGWMDPKDISVTWTKNFEVSSPSWSFALLGKVDQAGEKLAWIFTAGPSF